MMTIDQLQTKRIALLLSGGVDSSVVLAELCRLGVKPDCFYIKIGPEEDHTDWDCTAEEDLEMATAVAKRYGCPLEVVDCHRDYWSQVTRYTMDKVRQGLTPNPDVMCNRLIKFGAFHQKRGHDYDLIATGHYAQTETDSEGRKWLTTSPDPVKDQTDFLAQIHPWQLQKAIFPIGGYTKQQVRLLAKNYHLASAARRDSQGICFLGRISYADYLRRYLGEQRGDVVELESGRVVGQHRGHWFHTIGQRKGMGLGGGPWFVVSKDPSANIVYVSHGYDPQTAYCQQFLVRDFNYLTDRSLPTSVTIKIRHTPDVLKATVEPLNGVDGVDRFRVTAEQPIHGVAPGQFCVVYDQHHHRCFGSGEIALTPSTLSGPPAQASDCGGRWGC